MENNYCKSQHEIFPISGYFSKLGAHMTMLEDTTRVDAFAQALKSAIIPGKSIVLDIGCGTGILSMLAAQFGAKHVYAIESGPIIKLAEKLAQTNHLSDNITFLSGKFEDVKLPIKADIIVSETLGLAAVEENTVALMYLAAKRFAHEATIFLPSSFDVYLAPTKTTRLDAHINFWNQKISGFDYSILTDISYNNIYSRLYIDQADIIQKPQLVCSYKLGHDPNASCKKTLHFTPPAATMITGYVLTFRVHFDQKDSLLDTKTMHTHWAQALLPVRQEMIVQNDEYELTFEITDQPNGIHFRWSHTKTNSPHPEHMYSTEKLINYEV